MTKCKNDNCKEIFEYGYFTIAINNQNKELIIKSSTRFMTIIAIVITLVCALLAYLLVKKGKKDSMLVLENNQLKGRVDALQEITDKVVASQKALTNEDAEAKQKPVTVDSIRTALRFNGFSPEVPDANNWSTVFFKDGDTTLRINADNMPFIAIEVGFGLEKPKDEALLKQAAADITSHMYIGKAYITDNAETVIFSAEVLLDSYVHLRDNLKQYIGILRSANDRFFETYNILTEKKKEEREAIFSGNSFIQDSTHSSKVQS